MYEQPFQSNKSDSSAMTLIEQQKTYFSAYFCSHQLSRCRWSLSFMFAAPKSAVMFLRNGIQLVWEIWCCCSQKAAAFVRAHVCIGASACKQIFLCRMTLLLHCSNFPPCSLGEKKKEQREKAWLNLERQLFDVCPVVHLCRTAATAFFRTSAFVVFLWFVFFMGQTHVVSFVH